MARAIYQRFGSDDHLNKTSDPINFFFGQGFGSLAQTKPKKNSSMTLYRRSSTFLNKDAGCIFDHQSIFFWDHDWLKANRSP